MLGGDLEGEGGGRALCWLLSTLAAVETEWARVCFILECIVVWSVTVSLRDTDVARSAVTNYAACCAEVSRDASCAVTLFNVASLSIDAVEAVGAESA